MFQASFHSKRLSVSSRSRRSMRKYMVSLRGEDGFGNAASGLATAIIAGGGAKIHGLGLDCSCRRVWSSKDPCRLVRQVNQFIAPELLHLPHEAAGVWISTHLPERSREPVAW